MSELPVQARERVALLIRRYKPVDQLQMRQLYWNLFGEDMTQQAISYHCRRLGALRDADGFWYLPEATCDF